MSLLRARLYIVFVFLALLFAAHGAAATIVVTAVGDVAANDGICTLREAITAANTNSASGMLPGECVAGVAGADTITFNVSTACSSGVCTIVPSSALPIISEPVTIDGYTQPGSAPNTDPSGNNAILKIEVDGTALSLAGGVLSLAADDSIVRGLVVNRAGLGTSAIQINGGNNRIEGNFLGTNAAGTAALGNSAHGVIVETGSANVIGGAGPAARNVISGNNGNGVYLVGVSFATSGNVVQGNFVGTSADGAAGLGNLANGIQVSNTPNNLVAGNLVSANRFSGVFLLNGATVGNVIRGNRIGTDVTGTIALGNTFEGVRIDPTAGGNTVGGGTPGEGNVIAGNGEAGVGIGSFATEISSVGNAVRSNSIYSNGGLGIDLRIDGVTANDQCDPDSGANDLQNFPTLVFRGFASGVPNVQITLNSTANTEFAVDFFASPTCDPSGLGEGQTFLRSVTLTTDASCLGSTQVLLPGAAGEFVTATATNPTGGTSEFSACSRIPRGPRH